MTTSRCGHGAVGVVIRDLARRHSSWRAESDLDSYLVRHGIAGIAGIDTRRLTRHLRDLGVMPGAVACRASTLTGGAPRPRVGTEGRDLVAGVSVGAAYSTPSIQGAHDASSRWTSASRRRSWATSRGSVRSRWCGLDQRRGHPRDGARRGVPLQRPGGPLGGGRGAGDHTGPARRGARVRHLHGAPDAGHRTGRQHLQAPLRSPRRQPPRA